MLKSTLIASLLIGGAAFAKPVSDLKVKNAVIRAVPASASNSSAYFTLVNTSGKSLTLIGGHADWVKAVEIHQHVMKKDMMEMMRIPGLKIPAHGKVTLKPMGYHLMLIGLKKSFFNQKKLKLTLEFSASQELTIEAPVKRL